MAISTRKGRHLAVESSSMTDEAEASTNTIPAKVKQEDAADKDTSSGPEPTDDMDDEHSAEGKDDAEEKDDVEEKVLTPAEEEAKKKREAELREKYKNWPVKNVKEPHDNDVMYGRGGGTNHHPGNKRYRKMVEDRKLEYVNSKRLDKPLVALEIIRLWRAQIPSGRFLKLDEKTGLWNDVGDKKAREKTSQALREKAPIIRKQQEEGDEEEETQGGAKNTRFAEGTKKEDANQVKKAVLARDHSLGREYIEAGQAVSLDGFSWQDPFQNKQRETSYGRPAVPAGSYPAGRNSSHGSLGMAPPHHHVSVGGPVPPPPPDYWGRVSSNGARREFSNGRIESWGSMSYGYFPPPPPPPGHVMHQRSGSWTHGHPPPPGAPGGVYHRRSGSWGSAREHSFGMIPLIGASVANPADQGTFDSGRSWGEGVGSPPARGIMPGPGAPPPPVAYGGGGPIPSSGSLGPYRQPASPSHSTPSPKPYNVDMDIARTWSGGNPAPPPRAQQYDNHLPPTAAPGANSSPMRDSSAGSFPKPQIVKRDTSHQNENYETKPSIKRAALNRDNSLASNLLKQEYMPEYFGNKFDADREVHSLSTNLEQSTIDTERPKPMPLGNGERVSTMDAIAMDLMVKPAPILKDDRTSTIDALDLDLEADPLIKADELGDLPKPDSLGPVDRLTTNDFLELVNSPIATVDEATD